MSDDEMQADDPVDGPAADQPSRSRFPRWLKWTLGAVVAVIVLGYGAIFLYAKVLNDSPDELDESDLEAALAADGPAADAAPDTPASSSTSSPSSTPTTSAAPGSDTTATSPASGADPSVPTTAASPAAATPIPDPSQWVTTDASELGYRVKENLFGVDAEAVGRTNEVDGSITIEGTEVTRGEFVVDVASITSDESRRDGQFRGRIMATDEFPEASFVLTEPIELGTEPADGVEVTATATGDLTLRGVTNPVTFDIDARLENGRIGVLGNIPVVFADYDVPNPSTGGISTDDNGLLEFVLVFEPA